jgi:hypothetical protein
MFLNVWHICYLLSSCMYQNGIDVVTVTGKKKKKILYMLR